MAAKILAIAVTYLVSLTLTIVVPLLCEKRWYKKVDKANLDARMEWRMKSGGID